MARPSQSIRIDHTEAWCAHHARTEQRQSALNREDGTAQLLGSGWIVSACAALAAALVLGPLGGIGPEGPRSTAAWLLTIVAMMSMPFGLMLLLLGGAKWLRNRSLSQRE